MTSVQPTAVHILSGDLWGGAEAQMLHQLRALSTAGWRVKIALFNGGEVAARYEEAGLDCKIIPEQQSLSAFFRKSTDEIAKFKPKIIVSHGYKESFVAMRAARKLHVPWISTFHGYTEGYSGWARVKMAAYHFFYMLASKYSAAAIITVSQDLARSLGVDKLQRTHVFFNVSPAAAGSAAALIELEKPAILVVGRLVPVKRVDRALKVFEEVVRRRVLGQNPVPYLYILGDGPLREELERKAKELECADRISFLGFRRDADQLIGQAQVLLITSDSEGIPTVLLEAAGKCVPIVSTAVGGIPAVMEKLPGYPARLAELGADDQLTRAVVEMLTVEPSSETKLEIAEHYRSNFSPEVAAGRHAALYRSLTARLG